MSDPVCRRIPGSESDEETNRSSSLDFSITSSFGVDDIQLDSPLSSLDLSSDDEHHDDVVPTSEAELGEDKISNSSCE